MSLLEAAELYNLISRGSQECATRKQTRLLRKVALDLFQDKGFNKVAFDTRRVDQETDYIPRRGLQNYHRSEQFISDAIALKIESFSKLANILNELKAKYGREPEWQDSYTRILGEAVHKGLRTEQSDGDFSDSQPSMGSLSYLEELMYVRYRLTPEGIISMSDNDLRKTILSKDELLVRQGISHVRAQTEITPTDVSKYSYDQMMEKMLSTMAQVMSAYKPPQPDDPLTSKLFDIKATKDSPEVERTVTITIKDRIANNMDKTGVEEVSNKKTAIEEMLIEEE